jgi:hypothetical protein
MPYIGRSRKGVSRSIEEISISRRSYRGYSEITLSRRLYAYYLRGDWMFWRLCRSRLGGDWMSRRSYECRLGGDWVFRRSYAAKAKAICSEMRFIRSFFKIVTYLMGNIWRGDGDCVSPRSTKGVLCAAGVYSVRKLKGWIALPFVRGAGALIVV